MSTIIIDNKDNGNLRIQEFRNVGYGIIFVMMRVRFE